MKAALITGASGGIGEEFARQLAAKGHNLVLAARSADKLQALCGELTLKHQITAHFVAIDLSKPDADRVLFEETTRKGFEIDFLINNAGFGATGDFAGIALERQLEMISLNVSTLAALTHRYLPAMRRNRRGTIINVSSTASFQPIPYVAVYAATKAFVSSFSEAVAEENKAFGVTVSALCPGPTDTNFFAVADAEVFKDKGVQSSSAVVKTALKAASNGRAKVVSGLQNKFIAFFGSLTPNFIVTKFIGKYLRDHVPKTE